MNTLIKSLGSSIPLENNKQIKRNLFKKKQRKRRSRKVKEEVSESEESSESSSLSSPESQYSDGEEERLKESEKNRAREEKYKGKPILHSLDPGKVSVFLEELEVYEENVVKGRLRLPSADIVLCVNNNVQVMLTEEGVNLMSRKNVIKYLTKIRELQNKGKEKILMRRVEALTWTNEGTPMKSMGKFLKEITETTRGVKWETRSMEKEFCCKAIKKLPFEFGSIKAKETQSIKKWKSIPKLKRELTQAAIVISEWDLQSPALKLLTGELSAKRPKNITKSEEKSLNNPRGSRSEEAGPEKVSKSTLDNGAVRHHMPRSWSKEKRKQYGTDHNLCLFCYATNHRFENCELVKKRDADRKQTVNEMRVSQEGGEIDEGEEEEQSDGEESVFVGVIEVLDVEEDVLSEEEEGVIGSMNPVDLGEMLVEEEFEVGRDVGKSHKVLGSLEGQIIDEKQAKELESILVEHIDAFGSKIAKCDFNSLTPMKIELKEGVTEYVSKPYPMSKVNMEALKAKLRELEDMGMIRREPNPFFSSAVIMVPKPGKKDEFRMVVDLRRCNRSVKATGVDVPDLETQLAWFSGSEKYFGSFDGLSGFDYLRIEEGAEKYLGMSRAASIEEWWEDSDQKEVTRFMDSISVCSQRSLKLYQKENKIALFTDVSFQFWSGVLSLWDNDGWLPKCFGSGEFVGSSIHWSMTDKELYPIIKLMKRYRFILFSQLLPINLYTDHKNLTYLMTPKKDMKTATFGRVQRWILTMQEFDVIIHHLSGERNVLADLLIRWGYVESKETVELKEKLVDSNEDVGWRICWKGITFFANFRDVNIEKREIRSMIQTSDREEILEIQEEGGKGWRFDPELVKFVRDRVAVHFPNRKYKYKMITLVEVNRFQGEFVQEWKDMKLKKNAKGSWVDDAGRIVLPQIMVKRFVVTAHNAS
eukprot:augustus_masked-scaffold_16-processed-gene-5.2-mRNA-1 protein AED:1.00 eAED:1.00 QI:0/0/0/0/1/1/3/0/927